MISAVSAWSLNLQIVVENRDQPGTSPLCAGIAHFERLIFVWQNYVHSVEGLSSLGSEDVLFTS